MGCQPNPRQTRQFIGIRSPSDVDHVLVEHAHRYRKSAGYRLIASITGDGLLTNEGETWRAHRAAIQPMFSRSMHDHFVETISASTDQMLRDGAFDERDVATTLSRLTTVVTGRALFHVDLQDRSAQIVRDVTTVMKAETTLARLHLAAGLSTHEAERLASVLTRRHVPVPVLRRARDAMERLDEVAVEVSSRLVARTRQQGEPNATLRSMSPVEVRDEVMTLLLAGHETTANALAWSLCLLAEHPRWADQIRADSGRVDRLGSQGAPNGAAAACFREALRMYPPVWIVQREAISPDQLRDTHVEAGSTVVIPILLLHRDERWWSRPNDFEPERHMDQAAPPVRGSYLPFGAGRRSCIGSHLAVLEGSVVLSKVLASYDVLPRRERRPAEPRGMITLRPPTRLPFLLQAAR
jgi:cytochrome P450